jgi:uncharacterized protein (DUF488 family)
MFYRRKLLLALLESVGGALSRTDCQKLLFLFCQYTKKNHYDFFPYKYGSFSLLVHQDKKRLTDLGFLNDAENFELKPHNSFVSELKPKDQRSLRWFSAELKELRGRGLLRKAYLEYPQYTCRSEIIPDILTSDEVQRIQVYWNNDSSPCLFTLGYEGLTIDSYLDRLISNNIQALLDVRKNPSSMKYGFSKKAFKGYLEKGGIQYFHIPELGIASKLRQDLTTPESYKRLFERYTSEILPHQSLALEHVQEVLSTYSRIALTCFENDYHFCHRHKIAEYFDQSPGFHTRIVHL